MAPKRGRSGRRASAKTQQLALARARRTTSRRPRACPSPRGTRGSPRRRRSPRRTRRPGARFLIARRVLLGEARAVDGARGRARCRPRRVTSKASLPWPIAAKSSRREIEPLLRAGDAELGAERREQRVRRLERGLPAHRPALAAERVGDGLVEEERVVVALVGDELIAEAEEAVRRDLADEAAEARHAILRSSARSMPRMSSTAVSIEHDRLGAEGLGVIERERREAGAEREAVAGDVRLGRVRLEVREEAARAIELARRRARRRRASERTVCVARNRARPAGTRASSPRRRRRERGTPIDGGASIAAASRGTAAASPSAGGAARARARRRGARPRGAPCRAASPRRRGTTTTYARMRRRSAVRDGELEREHGGSRARPRSRRPRGARGRAGELADPVGVAQRASPASSARSAASGRTHAAWRCASPRWNDEDGVEVVDAVGERRRARSGALRRSTVVFSARQVPLIRHGELPSVSPSAWRQARRIACACRGVSGVPRVRPTR